MAFLEINFDGCIVKSTTLDKGIYELEVWGASGYSNSKSAGGKGGYARGILSLKTKTRVFIHTGGKGGSSGSAGCNGGGSGYFSDGGGGGGSSDIRIKNNSLFSRVIVAGGGGGCNENNEGHNGGFGGGKNGGDGENQKSRAGQGANQKNYTTKCADNNSECGKGAFGNGGRGVSSGGGGGGGGWFGGSGSSIGNGGGGGSGYVYTADSFKPEGFLLKEEYYLKDAVLLGGNETFPTIDKLGNETGHEGDGFARITIIKSFLLKACRKEVTHNTYLFVTFILINLK